MIHVTAARGPNADFWLWMKGADCRIPAAACPSEITSLLGYWSAKFLVRRRSYPKATNRSPGNGCSDTNPSRSNINCMEGHSTQIVLGSNQGSGKPIPLRLHAPLQKGVVSALPTLVFIFMHNTYPTYPDYVFHLHPKGSPQMATNRGYAASKPQLRSPEPPAPCMEKKTST